MDCDRPALVGVPIRVAIRLEIGPDLDGRHARNRSFELKTAEIVIA